MIEFDPYDLSDDQSDEVTRLAEEDMATLVHALVAFDESEFSYENEDALVIGKKLSAGLLEYAQKGGDLNRWTITCTPKPYAAGILTYLGVHISGRAVDDPKAANHEDAHEEVVQGADELQATAKSGLELELQGADDRQAATRVVAEHWRAAFLPEGLIPDIPAAHALSCVLGALDGATDVGIPENHPDYARFMEARS